MASPTPVRIAMWSGPRNISTAMMRAWGSRPDTYVCDEPLYAHYLAATGRPDPGRDEIVARHETDWRRVVAWLTGPVPGGRGIFYQKHITTHLLPEIDRAWLSSLRHAFLIRDPRAMLASLARVMPAPRLEDTGLPQQARLFEETADRDGAPPPVLDARDVLADPPAMLHALCDALGVAFDEAMLRWTAGPRPTDGVWARYWYGNVERSTGFQPYRPRPDALPGHLEDLCAACRPYYERLHAHRLQPR